VALLLALATSVEGQAQGVPRLTLADAEGRALKNHPEILSGEFAAQAAQETVHEARSAYYPTAYASVTGVASETGSRIAAGGLNNPIIFDRLAAGVAVGQLVTDFGRTGDLVGSFSLRADAQRQEVGARRADVVLQVDRAYFAVLRAQAVQRVAQATVAARQDGVDQVTALAASKLRSGLDVSFARVNLADAQLLLSQAQNDVQSAFAVLSAAMGGATTATYELAEEPMPALPSDGDRLVSDALRDRPDVAAARLAAQSAARFADAEHALVLPSVSAVAATGVAPYRQAGSLNEHYAAAGVNVNVPLTNGGLYRARGAEATLRARAEEQRVQDIENRVARDVRTAWLDARTAFERMGLTDQLLAQASDAADLVQARYDLGLSSVVELSDALLRKTQAEIQQATARHDYQIRMAALRFQIGAVR
jgi:outer membrane protein